MRDFVSWQGEHGPCCVGASYAAGDRRDLAKEILRLVARCERARPLPPHATDQSERDADEALAAALDPNHELNRRAIERMSDDDPEDCTS